MIYLIFGEMGIGKNHVGEKLAQYIDCPFFDGDTVIPKSMIENVLIFKPLTAKDIDNYVTNHLIPGIEQRYKEKLVVAQTLYRAEHREQIRTHFGEERVKLIWIPARPITEHFKRLLSRENGWGWVKYGLLNKPFFQNPSAYDDVHVIINEKNKDLNLQFEGLIKRKVK